MSITPAEQIEYIDISIEHAKEQIALLESIERLYKNRDFKKVIIEHYMKDEVVRIVHALASPANKHPDVQAGLQRRIAAVGEFSQFLMAIQRLAEEAQKAILDNEQAREAILAEEA